METRKLTWVERFAVPLYMIIYFGLYTVVFLRLSHSDDIRIITVAWVVFIAGSLIIILQLRRTIFMNSVKLNCMSVG
ncbi:hypothetical protein HGA64_04050, partial [Candidatus Falkowbacteria bacterium]|nr:hypothetical protein [Candidatus Falkowbacteria bacterium]